MNELMYINKRRKKSRRSRGRYRNPIISLGSGKRRSGGSNTNLITDVGLTAGGTIINLLVPSKVMGLTGAKKYLVQAGIMLGTATLLKGLIGSKISNRLALGQGVGLGISLINDLILAKQGKEVLSADEGEIPVLTAEEIPEIEAGSGSDDETVIIPETMEALEPETISALEPETISEEDMAEEGEA